MLLIHSNFKNTPFLRCGTRLFLSKTILQILILFGHFEGNPSDCSNTAPCFCARYHPQVPWGVLCWFLQMCLCAQKQGDVMPQVRARSPRPTLQPEWLLKPPAACALCMCPSKPCWPTPRLLWAHVGQSGACAILVSPTRYVILPGHVGCKLYSQPSLLSSTNAGPVGLGASGMATGRLLPWAFGDLFQNVELWRFQSYAQGSKPSLRLFQFIPKEQGFNNAACWFLHKCQLSELYVFTCQIHSFNSRC